MMIGMGTPRKNRSKERMVVSGEVNGAVVSQAGQASRRRPPQVAATLALKAPINSEANSHNAA